MKAAPDSWKTMKIRLLLVVFVVAIFGTTTRGQTTSVSATITDTSSQTWANGTYAFSFYPGASTGPFYYQGAPFTPTVFSGALDNSGSFSGVSIPSSNFIAPALTQWTLTVCPASTSQCFTQTQSIQGATQTLTVTPPPPVVSAQAQILTNAYTNGEISGARRGATYFNLTDNTIHVCTALPCSSNWVSIQSAGGAVTSWNTRTGNVVPLANDYSLSQISASYGPLFNLSGNTLNLGTQTGNCVIASPANGSAAVPTCRALTQNDLLFAVNASTLLNQTWASPGNIGTGTPGTGKFTTLAATNGLTVTGNPINTQSLNFNGGLNVNAVSGGSSILANTDSTLSGASAGTGVCANGSGALTTSGCAAMHDTNGGILTGGSCTTAASAFAMCQSTISLFRTEADTSYAVACTGVGINSGFPWVQAVITKSTTFVTVQISNLSSFGAVASQFAEIDCTVTR